MLNQFLQLKKNKKAFTLIEFLLIVGIVGLLVAVAFLVYQVVSKSSGASVWSDKGRTFMVSLSNYVRDNNNVYPAATCNSATAWGTGTCADLRNYVGANLANEGWQYVCNAGGNPTVSTPAISDAEIGFQVANKLSNFGQAEGWTCTYDTTTSVVNCTNANIICQ